MLLTKHISRIHGVWIPLLYAMVLIPLFFFHNTFEEWDGVMQFFAGKELLSGSGYNGWTSHFWPPLYSILTGIGSLFITGFEAAKLVSTITSILLLYVAYEFAMELSNDRRIGLLTQLFLILNPLYVVSSIQAENHMLDSLFFVSGILFLLKSLKKPKAKTLLITGLLCGLASLTRYTSYSLVPISVIAMFFFLDFKKAIKLSSVFLLGFSFASLPWWYYNTIENGSPLYTWQYMNIGYGVVQKISSYQWWWSTQSGFNGIWDIVSTMPFAYFKNFLINVIMSGVYLVMTTGVLAPFVPFGTFKSFIAMKPRVSLTILGLLTLFITMVSQAFIFDQLFLSWIVITTIVSVVFLLEFVAVCQKRYFVLAKYHFAILVVVFLSVTGLALTSYQTMSYINNKSDGGQLVDNDALTTELKEYDPNIETKYIMAIHPARAYYTGGRYLMIPLYYKGTLEGLVSYEGLSERVKTHVPRYPSTVADSDLRANYLVYDKTMKLSLPQFSYLFDPISDKIPENFKLVYQSEEVVVYEVL